MKARLVLLGLLLLPLVAASALEVEGGAEVEVELELPLFGDEVREVFVDNVKVYADPGIQVLSVERNGEKVYISAVVATPTPCHDVNYSVYAKPDDGYVKVYIYVNIFQATEGVCAQVLSQKNVRFEFTADPNVPLEVEIKRRVREPRVVEPFYSPVAEKEHTPLEYEVEVENNRAKVYIKGCYDYNVIPLKCPNCYEIRVTPSGTCEETVVYLEVNGALPVDVKVVPAVFAEVNTTYIELCKKAVAVLYQYDENIAQTIAEMCSTYPYEAYEKACDVLEELDKNAYYAVCERKSWEMPIIREPPTICRDIVAELNRYDPEVAKELAVRCEAGDYYAVREKACEVLEQLDKNAYYRVCEEVKIQERERAEEQERIEEEIKRVLETPTETVEQLKREIERLREEIEKYREEIKKLRIKVEELQRKLLITPKGIVDEETGEEIELPEVEVEVEYKGKPVVIKKEENSVFMEVNGPIKVKVEVEVPLAVDRNAIEVNGRVISVLPDEVVKRIQEQVRNMVLEQLRLTVENNRPVYEVEAKMTGRLLFIIPVEVPIKAYIDAETGTEIKLERPWWAVFVIG